METASILSLAAFIAINFFAASSGAIFKPGAWYAALNKPSWTPPNWAFPVIWSIIFCLNAVAGWLVWEAAGNGAQMALAAYGISLVFNGAWSALFFGMKRMDLAMVDLTAFWLSLVIVIAMFAPFSTTAALLLVPYILWVTVAGVLNLRMIQLNPQEARAA